MPLVYLLSWLLPMSWLRIPGLYKDAPFAYPAAAAASMPSPNKKEEAPQKKLPVIIFSHGLTGTGQENAALCTMWAKQGFIVAAVHHTDGSACHVTLADGSEHYYVHGPPMTEYDATFRPKQVLHRANEMLQACQFFSSSGECPEEIRLAADYPKRVVAAGYSFGAATVARAIVLLEKEQQQFQFQFQFCAALFLDGWFHIDVKKSAGIEFQFPQEAFDNDEQGNGDGDGLLPEDMPTCFINSEQFQNYDKLFAATNKLAGKNNPNVQVIAGTGHQNFCDVVFWMHNSVLRSLMMGAVGKTVDPGEAFQDIVQRSITFLKKAAAASA
jgi:platelet-activating factor acetylhydrolase